MPARTLGPQGGWIVKSHIGWREERNIPYKGVETSPQQTHFKPMRLTAIHNGPKRIISVSGGLGLLQMVLEPDIKRCVNEDVGPQGG